MPFHLSNLPKRTGKPRNTGITMALDSGFSVRQAEDFCSVASHHVDIIKLGWGTSYVTGHLKEKLSVYREYEIPVYFGGTLFEAYLIRDELENYIEFLRLNDIKLVEVSNGTIRLSEHKKLDIIRELTKQFKVLSEVGSKNPNDIIPPYKWVKMIKNELEAGAWKVICEARESGNVGIFRPNGEIRSGLIEEVTDQIPHESLIFEAPKKDQQIWFIKKYGSNVNLGNIKPDEVIPVETLRLGLRSDTLTDFYTLQNVSNQNILESDPSNRSQENY